MPAKLDPILKEACRVSYLKGDSVRAVSEKYGVPKGTLEKVCQREGWVVTRRTINDRHNSIEHQVGEKVVEKLADKAALRVSSHLESVFSTGSNFMKQLSESLTNSMSLPPILDAATALQSITAYGKADGLVRRSLGLADTVQEVSVSGTVDHNHVLSLLETCRKVKDSAPTIDVDQVIAEADGCEKEGK